jgi:hypothetical protein
MVDSFEGIGGGIGRELLPICVFRVHVMRIDVALLDGSVHFVGHLADKFMNQKRVVDFL